MMGVKDKHAFLVISPRIRNSYLADPFCQLVHSQLSNSSTSIIWNAKMSFYLWLYYYQQFYHSRSITLNLISNYDLHSQRSNHQLAPVQSLKWPSPHLGGAFVFYHVFVDPMGPRFNSFLWYIRLFRLLISKCRALSGTLTGLEESVLRTDDGAAPRKRLSPQSRDSELTTSEI